MSESTLTVGDTDLRVYELGGTGPCVVLLHGLGGYALEWCSVASRVAEVGRVVAFDQRGHAGSTRRPEHVSRAAFVADVEAVVRSLGSESVVLVGQSMGAHTALLAAAAWPELIRGLVLVEGGVGGEDASATAGVMQWFESWPVPFRDRAAAVDFFGHDPAGEGWASGLEDTPSGLIPRFDLKVLRRAIDAVHDKDRWPEWADVRCPVLLVKAENGYLPTEEAQRMLATNRNARVVEIADAGHDVHLDAPERLAEEIAAFLGELG